MMRNRLMMRTMAAGPAGRLRVALALVVAGALSGCGGGSMFGASSDSSPSISDRFGQLFGSKSQAVGEAAPPPAADNELSCPQVSIRAGASTFAVAAPGKQAVGNDLRYQATITRTARDCTLNGGQITARIGIQGRVIAGPAGNPPTIEIPLRVAVVQSGVQEEKTIATKVYRTTVSMEEGSSVPFSLVAEDLVYPVPPGATGDNYVFYIGFDPQALKPEPKAPARRKK
jgi:hypothetical protein